MIRLIIAAVCFGLFYWNPYPLQLAELKSYDWLIMNSEPVQNDNIVLIDIDESMIEAYGGYPLPRSFLFKLFKKNECSRYNSSYA